MANTSKLISVSGTHTFDYQDSVTEVYRVTYDTIPTNEFWALIWGQTASGSPLPFRRQLYANIPPSSPAVYCTALSGRHIDASRSVWEWTVAWGRPPQGEQQDSFEEDNPLERPAKFDIQYMDRERVIDKAKNLEALLHGDGKGGNRAANTLGPVVNAAGKRPDEPLVDTERLEVLVIRKNFASLSDIVSRNRTYKRTTNSDTAQGYETRELRYLLTESQGEQIENGVTFWPGVTTILAEDSTDLTLDNVGMDYWSVLLGDWNRITDGLGNFQADPINLKLDGDAGGDITTTITYRHLNAVAYASLFT